MALSIFLTVVSPYVAILPIIYIAYKVFGRNDIVYKNPWNNGLLFLFFWSLIVGIINKSPVSAAASVGFIMYYFLCVYFQNFFNSEHKIRKLLNGIIIASVGSALIGVLEKLYSFYFKSIWWGYLFSIPTQSAAENGYRISATFGNPNVAGTWFAAMILISFYLYSSSLSKLIKVLYGCAIILFIIVLDLTGSRGAALGLLMGIAIYAFFNEEKKDTWFLGTIFITVAVLMFIPQTLLSGFGKVAPPVIDNLNSPMTHEVSSSVASRNEIWSDCLNIFKLKPVTGWGIMGIYYASSDIFHYFSREPHAHNIWLTMATTLGIVGLAVYLYMKLYIVEELKLLYANRNPLLPLLAAIQVLIVGHGIVDFTIITPQGAIILMACSSFINSLAVQYDSSRIDESFSISLWFKSKKPARLNL